MWSARPVHNTNWYLPLTFFSMWLLRDHMRWQCIICIVWQWHRFLTKLLQPMWSRWVWMAINLDACSFVYVCCNTIVAWMQDEHVYFGIMRMNFHLSKIQKGTANFEYILLLINLCIFLELVCWKKPLPAAWRTISTLI